MLTVNIDLTGVRYFNVDKLVRLMYEFSQATESEHVDAGVQNGKESQVRKQKEGRDSFVVNIRV